MQGCVPDSDPGALGPSQAAPEGRSLFACGGSFPPVWQSDDRRLHLRDRGVELRLPGGEAGNTSLGYRVEERKEETGASLPSLMT